MSASTGTLLVSPGTTSYAPIDILPPEILQTIWRYLTFYDLLRCQQICKKWKGYLPGTDQALHRATFSPGAKVDPQNVASWVFLVAIQMYFSTRPSQLPRLAFELIMKDRGSDLDNEEGEEEGEGDLFFHPMLRNVTAFGPLMVPPFTLWEYDNDSVYMFHCLEELDQLAEEVERENESWEQMLACIPGVKKLNLKVVFETDSGSRRRTRDVENTAGVTVWDVVEAVRGVLGDAREIVASLGQDMTQVVGVW